MNGINNLRFILHVSDFHLSTDEEELIQAQEALKTLTSKLKSEGIKVDYLIHTGDVINSGDLFLKVAKELEIDQRFIKKAKEENGNHGNGIEEQKVKEEKFLSQEYQKAARDNIEAEKVTGEVKHPNAEDLRAFDNRVLELVKARFEAAGGIMNKFIADLNIAVGNVIICCGNHDVLKPLSIDQNEIECKSYKSNDWRYKCPADAEKIIQPFENFLDTLNIANSQKRRNADDKYTGKEEASPVIHCILDDLNVLILNTNQFNPKDQESGCYCVRCDRIIETLEGIDKEVQDDNSDTPPRSRLNIILAHKPLYEICERTRLSYKRYTKTPFFSKLQGFAGENGIYLCGDKHTRSIVGSQIHDIPHYIGGEPIAVKGDHDSEAEYNLLAIENDRIAVGRKLHLSYEADRRKWSCEIRPQDDTVKELYKHSRKYIIDNTFKAFDNHTVFRTWEDICQITYSWTEKDKANWYQNVDNLYTPICRYRINGIPENNDLPSDHIFQFIQKRIIEQMKKPSAKNVLNIRGEHGSGKSMFLGLFYIHLMIEYSEGAFDFIPAYFNMENKEIYKRIEEDGSYYKAVRHAFKEFADKVQEIADKERQPICFLIDGLDELDCWSYSTEDSIGRGLLDILAEHDKAWYLMAFSQHNLPRFKNTMPTRKYNDTSDIMYFNSVDVNDESSEISSFTSFVKAFLQFRRFPSIQSLDNSGDPSEKTEDSQKPEISTVDQKLALDDLPRDVCNIIRSFRRLTINSGFLFQNYKYLTEFKEKSNELLHKGAGVAEVYNYYIDRQYELCLEQLEYGFIDYAPAMAYLFSYKGYTYEKFKHLHQDSVLSDRHTLKPICKNDKKIYHTFLFIKKNRDAREYLIALHYNRELRYYAEHPNEKIEDDSILNEFITRNIALLVRKLWTDTNKFVIACEHLLQREELSNCAQAMLIYCLAHLQIYEPIRNKLQDEMRQKGKETLIKQGLWDDDSEACNPKQPHEPKAAQNLWRITGKNDAEKLTNFLQLSLKHAMEIFDPSLEMDSSKLINKYARDEAFRVYNRQYQMLYYGDLSVKNDANIHPLKPGQDIVYGGFDFHDCFNFLHIKLTSSSEYPLRAYDLFTLCDLITSRLNKKHRNKNGIMVDTFFYREKDKSRASIVLSQVFKLLQPFTTTGENSKDSQDGAKRTQEISTFGHFKVFAGQIKETIEKTKPISSSSLTVSEDVTQLDKQ